MRRQCGATCCSDHGVCSAEGGGRCDCELGYGDAPAWNRVAGRYCSSSAGDTIGSYDDEATAQAACSAEPACLAISDGGCDGVGSWYTCRSASGTSSSSGSCLYQKQESEGFCSAASPCTTDQIRILAGSAASAECGTVCCSGNGECRSDGTCGCELGHSGAQCQDHVCTAPQIFVAALQGAATAEQCAASCCSGRGECLSTQGGVCGCELGYRGSRCELAGCAAHEIAAMATQPALAQRCADVCCSGRGPCSADGGGACACDDSHHGAACELDGAAPPPPPPTTSSTLPCCSDWCAGCGLCAPGRCGTTCGVLASPPCSDTSASCRAEC